MFSVLLCSFFVGGVVVVVDKKSPGSRKPVVRKPAGVGKKEPVVRKPVGVKDSGELVYSRPAVVGGPKPSGRTGDSRTERGRQPSPRVVKGGKGMFGGGVDVDPGIGVPGGKPVVPLPKKKNYNSGKFRA